MRKHLFILFLSFIVSISVFAGENKTTDLTILYTNDIHAQVRPMKILWKGEETHFSGFPQIATLVKNTRKRKDHVLFLSAGDVMTGPPISRLTKGKAVFDLMNLMGYDAMCLGNHEFDQGWRNVVDRIYQADFPVLGANIFYKNTSIPFTMPCCIIEKGPFKIGIIGILGRKAALETINTRLVDEIEFRDQISILQDWVPRIRPHVDVLILLAHEGVAGMQSTTAEQDKQRRLDTDIDVAGKVPGIDVLITGHAHRGVEIPIIVNPNGTRLVSTYGLGTRLGELILHLDIKTRQIISHEGRLIPVLSDTITADPEVEKRLKAWEAQVNSITEEIIGHADIPLTRDYYHASPLGSLSADAIRMAAGTDIAITNSGGLRADIGRGPVTAGQILAVYPFENPIVTMTLKGEQIIRLLEHGATYDYGIAQISGIDIVIDVSKPRENRVISATVNGNALLLEENYTVATSDYLANGGDAYTVFQEADDIHPANAFCTEAIIDYVRKKGTITEEKSPRIIVKGTVSPE